MVHLLTMENSQHQSEHTGPFQKHLAVNQLIVPHPNTLISYTSKSSSVTACLLVDSSMHSSLWTVPYDTIGVLALNPFIMMISLQPSQPFMQNQETMHVNSAAIVMKSYLEATSVHSSISNVHPLCQAQRNANQQMD
jgi:hypothetical protein